MGRIVESDYNGFFVSVSAEPAPEAKWRPRVSVTQRLGYAVVPKPVQPPGVYATEDEAVDFAIAWVRQQIDEKKIR